MNRDPELLAESRALRSAVAPHATLAALRSAPDWPDLERRFRRLLGGIRLRRPDSPPGPAAQAERVKAVHWNIEHGNGYRQVESALVTHDDLRDADVILLNECDLGMARSGNGDIAFDLARATGFHAAWAPLFLETTSGRNDDARFAGGEDNLESLFGLAILSRWPLAGVRVVELPSPERHQFEVERMVGRHVALVAVVEHPRSPFVAVAVHLEVHRTRAHRAAQMRLLLQDLAAERRPVLIAGDFNSHTFDRGRAWDPWFGAWVLMFASARALDHRLLFPDHGATREPLFDELRRAGFTWDRLVDRQPTLQLRFERVEELRAFPDFVQRAVLGTMRWAEKRGRLRLDWFAARGWPSGRGYTVPGLDGHGRASDHAPIVAELW
jgi:endonuclease/exonuclease/phosphatase family metal-dependent hydrolase